jgi:3-oxoacyl-[acyl-carrier protein] reductase
MDLGLTERACIVTGASRGIGRATVSLLAAEGASLLLIGRGEDALAAAARELRGAEGAIEWIALDVTDPDAGERCRDACLSRFGRIDVLVNNAGTSVVRALEELTDEDWQSQWELNVIAPMRLMRAAAPAMAERGWGRIVNVCSSSGKRPSQRNAAYSVTKAAQLSLSRVYADAYAARGVLVNALAPGPIASELWLDPGGLADQTADARGITREQVLEATAAGLPLQRLGTAEEIGAVVTFLCSEAASNVSGAAWGVDGGAVPVII